MITISSFTHRLGNQLFQIAAAYTLAKKHGVEFLCPEWKYSKYFNTEFKKYNGELIEKYWSEPGFHYSDIPFRKNMSLSGYFQSWKYFDDSTMRDVFMINVCELFPTPFHEMLSIDNLVHSSWGLKDVCAIHVRRSDYLNYPDHHPVCTMDYYDRAMSESGFKKFAIFSDDPEWCLNNFTNPDYATYISCKRDIEDFYLMSICGANIIANSTFSWWAALLNKNAQIVISPHKDNWHGYAYAHWNHDDLIPENWKQIRF